MELLRVDVITLLLLIVVALYGISELFCGSVFCMLICR